MPAAHPLMAALVAHIEKMGGGSAPKRLNDPKISPSGHLQILEPQ